MKLMIDLFSGLGGASEAFHRSRSWEVQRYDNSELVRDVDNTSIVDLTEYQVFAEGAEVVWASPPCTEFSNAFNAPGPNARREGVDFEPSLELVERAIVLIGIIQPKYWIIENVIGSISHLHPLLGGPRQIIGPFVLWGNFPYLNIPRDFQHSKYEGEGWSTDPLRVNRRALIPVEISAALLEAVSTQTTLESWAHQWGVDTPNAFQERN